MLSAKERLKISLIQKKNKLKKYKEEVWREMDKEFAAAADNGATQATYRNRKTFMVEVFSYEEMREIVHSLAFDLKDLGYKIIKTHFEKGEVLYYIELEVSWNSTSNPQKKSKN